VNRFAFLIHPLDMKDVVRYEPKAAGKREALVEKIFEWMPPYEASHITGLQSPTGTEAEGWFITVPLMPRQFLEMDRAFVYDKILRACELGRSLGAQIVGLGAFTSVVGDAGITIQKRLDGFPVTSGNSFTVASAISGTLKAAREVGIPLKTASVTVVGASGSIGRVCAHTLARKVGHLTLVARNLPRLKKVAESIQRLTGMRPEVTTELSHAVQRSDVILTATSSVGNIIRAEDLQPGTVVCDVSLPHDVAREVARQRPDILVIEGGLIEVPGRISMNFDFGYPQGMVLACMAETMILALEGRFEAFSLGREIQLARTDDISRLARRHGFRLAGFRSFDQAVTPEQISRVRKEAAMRLARNEFLAKGMATS